MTDITTSVPLVTSRPIDTPLRTFCRDVFRLIAFWHERARQRAALSDLDDRMLRDVGLTRLDAKRECEKPFWR